MKKRNVINLIRYHSDENDTAFRGEAYEIARDFDAQGDHQLAEYIMALMSNANTFIPQGDELESAFLEKMDIGEGALWLPIPITNDIKGIVNAASRNLGVSKFMFQGPPGTGKTETAKQIARMTSRDLYNTNFSAIIDSKMGQTQRNIVELFSEINSFPHPEKAIILLDEIDALALDRANSNDLREMGRVTSALLKELDRVNGNIILIATTNLFRHFDKALVRRFDSVVDFSRYSQEDLLGIAESMLDHFLAKCGCPRRNVRLFRKIIGLFDPIPYPGELKNLIRTSIAFSDPNEELSYLKRLYLAAGGEENADLQKLQKAGFTLREIEVLSGVSKSQAGRELRSV